MAQDMNKFRALKKIVMNNRVPLIAGSIWTSQRTKSFSGKTLLHDNVYLQK